MGVCVSWRVVFEKPTEEKSSTKVTGLVVRIHSAPVLKYACGSGMALIELIFILSGACVVLFWLARGFMMLALMVCWPIPGNFFTSMGKWAGEVFFTQ